MSKVTTIEGVEGEGISVHKVAHPAEAALVRTAAEAIKYAEGVVSTLLPKQLGFGRAKNTILVQLESGEWVRVTIKVTGVDTSDES